MAQLGDETLGLNTQSRAILALLSDIECPQGLQCSTRAFYNGRERGFLLSVMLGYNHEAVLHIAVGEDRSSDSTFVTEWVAPVTDINPPTVSDIPESAYANRKYFLPFTYGPVLACIDSLIKETSNVTTD